MGYAMMLGTCANCQQAFIFNPHRVPSVRVNGVREPSCKPCIERANPVRKAKGLAECVIHPDAYEPIDEREL